MNILLIEDEPVDRLIFKQFLTKTTIAFSLKAVERISEGLESLEQENFDIVFCDFNLPDGSAISFLEKIRASNHNVPVVIVTSFNQEDWISIIMKKGGYNFLHKKRINAQILETTIEETVAYFKKRAQITPQPERTILYENDELLSKWFNQELGVLRVNKLGLIERAEGGVLKMITSSGKKRTLEGSDLRTYFIDLSSEVIECFEYALNGNPILEVIKIGPVYFQFDFIPVKSEEGIVEGTSVIIKDVTLESIKEEALSHSVKISKSSERSLGNDIKNRNEGEVAVENRKKERLFIKDKSQYVSLKLEEILWIEAYGDFVKVNCLEQNFVVIHKLSDALMRLPDDEFLQVHRSYVVRLDKISQINKASVTIGEQSIPVSRSYRNTLFEKIDLF